MRTVLPSSSPLDISPLPRLGLPLVRMLDVRSAGDWRMAAASCSLRMSLKLPVLPTIPRADAGVLEWERCGVEAGTRSLGSGLRIFVLSLGRA